MQTLKIDADKAKKLYPTASQEFKEMLHDSFGEKFFLTKITDRIKTFEDACDAIRVEPGLGFCIAEKDELAYRKLKIIAKALNEGWTPDWINSNQYKYYPWFDLSSGFLFNGVDCYCTNSSVGSRLCFKSRELAEYAGTQFLDLYKDYLK